MCHHTPQWTDGSSVEFVDFAPGEPNEYSGTSEDAVEMDFRQGLTRFGEWNDASSDEVKRCPRAQCCVGPAGSTQARSTQATTSSSSRNLILSSPRPSVVIAVCCCCCCSPPPPPPQTYEMFPLCETSVPSPIPGQPMTWGTDTTSSFDIRVCIDQDETLYFQDDRLWFQYGGV